MGMWVRVKGVPPTGGHLAPAEAVPVKVPWHSISTAKDTGIRMGISMLFGVLQGEIAEGFGDSGVGLQCL